ncbi:hypothetical protein BU23DRAFT_37985 [Bimuria novae-zelandiae CBS 107.79]|uniref:Uncharacterized protein n=1 Tax=Bimuria novae-zelandiae CBS 107.79 TaxID=1447943 RepID=A0A6A5UJK6_9PLEO|nr:hypothetical protein BU23DRAFT_37985 [Bimuria novae-zelandiae CBS 107.79]
MLPLETFPSTQSTRSIHNDQPLHTPHSLSHTIPNPLIQITPITHYAPHKTSSLELALAHRHPNPPVARTRSRRRTNLPTPHSRAARPHCSLPYLHTAPSHPGSSLHMHIRQLGAGTHHGGKRVGWYLQGQRGHARASGCRCAADA